jgi:hypothetical protein
MRRTLAIALAAVLLAGGCAHHRAGAEAPTTSQSPAAPQRTAASSADKSDLSGGGVSAGGVSGGGVRGASATDDVDQLLDRVDKQLRSDDQPAEDQD